MQWVQEYERLTERDKEEFARIINLLFDQTYLVRDLWDVGEKRMVTNRDYLFAERLHPLLEGYLKLAGFQLQRDPRLGVMALYNRFGRNRERLDKYTTYVLITLRLIYEEQMERAALRHEVIIPLREILVKLHTLGKIDRRVPVTQLSDALSALARHQVVGRIDRGVPVHDLDGRWMIYPAVVLAVPVERIQEWYEQLSAEDEDAAEVVTGDASSSDADALRTPGALEEVAATVDVSDPEEVAE